MSSDLTLHAEVAPYEYAQLPLTPTLMASLIRRLYSSGEVVRRDQMIDRVVAYHQQRGGALSDVSPVSQMKKALGDLSASGSVVQTGVYGLWRIIQGNDDDDGATGFFQEEIVSVANESVVPLFEVLNESGEGSGCLYVYYFPTYRRDEGSFPIKVGMSEGSYERRIAEQLGTSNPEVPVIYRVPRTEQPRLVERFLHAALSLRGSHMDDAPGQEWFMTTPESIDELLSFVDLLEPVSNGSTEEAAELMTSAE